MGGARARHYLHRRETYGYVAATFAFGAKALDQPLNPVGYRLFGSRGCWLVAPSTVPGTFAQACVDRLLFFQRKTGTLASAIIYRAGFGILGGSAQTVPVGELVALAAPLREELRGHPWVLVTDHRNHVKGWRSGRKETLNTALSDRWREFWEAEEGHEELQLLWTKSHGESTLAGDIHLGRSPELFLGNSIADFAAGAKGDEAAAPSDVANRI